VEEWRRVFREGVAPVLPAAGLAALRDALARDDPRLVQGCTTSPPPLDCVLDWPCEAACPTAFCRWQGGESDGTVGDCEEFFAKVCYEADQRLGEPAAVRFFLDWVDDTPRDEMRRLLLAEVDLALAGREAAPAA
jgi:hypothetical protein